jgi:hypothetical protein
MEMNVLPIILIDKGNVNWKTEIRSNIRDIKKNLPKSCRKKADGMTQSLIPMGRRKV